MLFCHKNGKNFPIKTKPRQTDLLKNKNYTYIIVLRFSDWCNFAITEVVNFAFLNRIKILVGFIIKSSDFNFTRGIFQFKIKNAAFPSGITPGFLATFLNNSGLNGILILVRIEIFNAMCCF